MIIGRAIIGRKLYCALWEHVSTFDLLGYPRQKNEQSLQKNSTCTTILALLIKKIYLSTKQFCALIRW